MLPSIPASSFRRCNLDVDHPSSGFLPFWVETFKPSAVWSGQDDRAVQFGPVDSWQYFLVLVPQAGPRLQVRVPSTGGVAFVPSSDVGPSGPPPPNGSCMPGGRTD